MTLRVGLTGGIGSGKSTVAAMFATWAVPILDLDVVAKELLSKPKVMEQIYAEFGEKLRQADGSVDRKKLAAHVFASPQRTRKLNRIMHPRIRKCEDDWFQQQISPYVLIEASVLIESGEASRMDRLVVVLADKKLRKQRVLKRGEQDISMFNHIIARQCSDEQRIQLAAEVLDNRGSLEALAIQVERLHMHLLEQCG